jgi:hypothetical protein
MVTSIDLKDKSVLLDERLDCCVTSFIETYDQLLDYKMKLNKNLDVAYLNMSKARSLIGCSRVSILQVPNEMEPKVKVIEEKDDCNEDINRYKLLIEKSLNKKVLEETNESASSPEEDDLKSTIVPFPDWFGVFPPQNLRTSHSSFAESLNTIIHICNLQQKLKYLENVYKTLLEERKKNIDE